MISLQYPYNIPRMSLLYLYKIRDNNGTLQEELLTNTKSVYAIAPD